FASKDGGLLTHEATPWHDLAGYHTPADPHLSSTRARHDETSRLAPPDRPSPMPSLPWNQIDTVLLDMDGTLLDLHFDNHFWRRSRAQRYAQHRGVSLALAEAELLPLFRQHAGTLNWYCTDFWSRELQLSMRELKREVAHLIALRPDADVFL